MNTVANFPAKDRKELFEETARKMGVQPAIIEKDFWVVWVLGELFKDGNLSKILMFKGGTSLSKVFGLIGRFSEDIDLILDWREITDKDLLGSELTKNQQDKLNKKINEEAKAYIKKNLLPLISDLLSPLCQCYIDPENPHNILVTYPASFDDGYLRPQILLEIGPLASWLPSKNYTIHSYAAEKFPELFKNKSCQVNAILAKRTFWEKATILHQEANRDHTKSLPPRYSRHYYDLAIMAKSEVKNKAFDDLELLRQVVEFKKRFYPASWAKFEDAKPGTFKLLPPDFRITELQKDYRAMEHMIFDKVLSFEEIMETLRQLEDEINHLKSSTL